MHVLKILKLKFLINHHDYLWKLIRQESGGLFSKRPKSGERSRNFRIGISYLTRMVLPAWLQKDRRSVPRAGAMCCLSKDETFISFTRWDVPSSVNYRRRFFRYRQWQTFWISIRLINFFFWLQSDVTHNNFQSLRNFKFLF